MKKFIKRLSVISLSLMCVFALVQPVYGASYTVTASSTSVYVGDTVTISISGAVEGMVNVSATNATVSSSTVWVGTNSGEVAPYVTVTFTVTPKSAGTTVVTVTPTGTDGLVDSSFNSTTEVKTVSITVKEKSTSSSSSSSSGTTTTTPTEVATDLTLSSLEVSEGTLSPTFSASNVTYSVDVDNDVTSIDVSAIATAGDDVTLSGTGTHELEEKDNKIEVVVKDEKGNTKTYTINVYREPTPTVYLTYGESSLGVLTLDKSPVLTGFEQTTITYGDEEVEVFHNTAIDIYVLYMIDEEGNKGFYLYDIEEETIISKYDPITINGNSYVVIDVPSDMQEKSGFTFTTIVIDEVEYAGFVYEDSYFENYSLIYLMDDMGNMNWYQYESSEGTLQLFNNTAPITQEDYELLLERENMLTIGLYVCGAVAGILAISSIALLLSRGKIRKELRSTKLQIRSETIVEPVEVTETL